MLSYHRNDAHGVGLKALKIRDDIAEIAVEADLNAVAQVFQIVAREAVDMVHREHREGRGTLAEILIYSLYMMLPTRALVESITPF